MLRSASKLLNTIKYGYNNNNNWRRYQKNFPLQAEPTNFKKEFKAGDKAEFAYGANVAWPKEYKPWMPAYPYQYIIVVVMIILYIDARYERKRVQLGK